MLKSNEMKNFFEIHFNMFLFIAKALVTALIFEGLSFLSAFNNLWIWLTWIGLSIAVDTLLIFKEPTFFKNTSPTEEEKMKFGLDAKELAKYLLFSPKLRLISNLSILLEIPSNFGSYHDQTILKIV